MEEIIKSMNECNTIRYASYRTASKMQVIHQALKMNYIQVELIAGVFERHRLSITENTVNIDIHEIEDVLSDIYFAAQKENNINIDAESCIKLAIEYIFKTFNKKSDENIPVFAVKVALTLVSCGRLEEKYGYLFHQLADHNACLSRAALNTLLSYICKVTNMLGENVAYGKHLIRTSIEKCFNESQGCLGVTESEFAAWLMQEPPLLMWITTLNRMKSAEHVVHNLKCSSCKLTPIRGPRYCCLKCSGYNQCQKCFLYGQISNKHKLKHPVREYCIKTTDKEITKVILQSLRNKIRICSTNDSTNLDDSESFKIHKSKTFDSMSVRSTIKRRILNDPQKELQSIISHLENENKQLQLELKNINASKVEKLQHHRSVIESQLDRLKILKNYLFTQTEASNHNFIQSTPMATQPTVSRISSLPIAFQLSPITHQSCSKSMESSDSRIRDKCNKKNESKMSHINLESSDNAPLTLSCYIGENRTTFSSGNSGFSQWLQSEKIAEENTKKVTDEITNTKKTDIDPSTNIKGKSVGKSFQNIQGDLNEILDRLQNMVANDCLLEESFSADNNCELKRAATEMEDLLTGLIEGMESRKGKSTNIV